MKRVCFKYLMVFICFFSVMAKTGITLNAVFHIIKSSDTACAYNNCNDDENTPERSETKEIVKEYWDVQHQLVIAAPVKLCKPAGFINEPGSKHLAWVPPVPTPPPNI